MWQKSSNEITFSHGIIAKKLNISLSSYFDSSKYRTFVWNIWIFLREYDVGPIQKIVKYDGLYHIF